MDRRDEILRGGLQRFDCEMEVVGTDPATGHVVLRLVPDPRRYDEIERDGTTLFVDRFTGVGVALETIVEAFKRAGRVPSHHLPPLIESSLEYARTRLDAVRHELATGEHVAPATLPRKHRDFEHAEERAVTFISVDVCGATVMRARGEADFDRAFDLFFQELATAVGHFHGSILKTTGDGFIAYLDHPSVLSRDNAVDLARTLLALTENAVNVALAEASLPTFRIRVGADDGPARLRTFRSPTTGFSSVDVTSDALNRAVKLQEAARPGTLLIGEALRERLHIGWVERTRTADAAIAEAVGIPGYRCFEVD